MLASEVIAWTGGFILIGVTAFYMIFGKANEKYKHQRTFGTKSVILGNKSAEIPKKVLAYMFISAFCCFLISAVLYSHGY